MNPKTDAQMLLLAGAKTADGEWLYPGLQMKCPECYGNGPLSSYELVGIHGAAPMYGCLTCTEREGEPSYALGYIPSPDPMALIAACQSREWEAQFTTCLNNNDEQEPMVVVWVEGTAYEGSPVDDNEAALTDALFQATVPLAANWERCGTSMHLNEGQDGDCPFCSGTGFILRSEGRQDGN